MVLRGAGEIHPAEFETLLREFGNSGCEFSIASRVRVFTFLRGAGAGA